MVMTILLFYLLYFIFLYINLLLYFIETNIVEVGTLFSEENIKVIENIFKAEFGRQGKNIVNLISANLKIKMDEVKKTPDEMKKLGKEVACLKQSLEFTEIILKVKVKKLDEKHVNLKN